MTPTAEPPRERPALAGLLLLSAAILLLEIGQVRVFSYLLWHHVTYLVVTVTLLGFAAGGTWLAIRPRREGTARAASAALAFGALAVAAFATMARHHTEFLPQENARWPALSATLSYFYLVVPYFFGGVAIAAALDGDGKQVSRRYAVNMIGSALGCLLVLPLLRLLGATGVVLAAAGLALVGAGLLAVAARRPALAAAGFVLGAGVLLALPRADALLPFPVAPGKALAKEIADGKRPVFSQWDPICRIDVCGDEAADENLRVYQDGDAPTWIPSHEVDHTAAVPGSYRALGYSMRLPERRKSALIIGVGGGSDILTALTMGAEKVLGAEINVSTAAMMRGRFAAYSGSLYGDPRVTIQVADGRSVVARSQEKFDIIQITGADTYAAMVSGANLVAESYLYTQEALLDYVDHLNDDGALCVLRWRFFPPRETLRLVGMAARALKLRGAADPRQHIVVLNVSASGAIFGEKQANAHYGVTVVKKTPLTPQELKVFRRFVTDHPNKELFSLAYIPGGPSETEFDSYLGAIATSDAAAAAFEEAYPFAVDPATDDRPFFFQYFRGKDVLAEQKADGKTHFHEVIGDGPAGLQVMWLSLVAAVALLLLLVVLPLFAFRRDGLKVEGGGRMVLFFAAVGLAYLAVEIATLQRLTLYLGHPLLGLGLGLSTFLLGSGLGAAATARAPAGRERAWLARGALVVVLLLAVHAFLVPQLFHATLHLGEYARQVIAVLAIAPLAFFMGFPFPLGLRLARAQAAPLLPWAFGVNGGASVLASVLAILVAMETGFRSVLVFSLALYLLAAFTAPPQARAQAS